jgi:hypothetical protein
MRRVVHKEKNPDSDVESEEDDDDDEHPRGGEGKRPLTTRQAVLASVVGSSHVSLGASQTFQPGYGQFLIEPLRLKMKHHRRKSS